MKQKINEDELNKYWGEHHGAAYFSFKDRNVYLTDGGLFSIEKKKVMLHKVVGFKKRPDGCREVLFSKKKYPHDSYEAVLWFEELHDTILYLQRMEKFLNKLGFTTRGKPKCDAKETTINAKGKRKAQ